MSKLQFPGYQTPRRGKLVEQRCCHTRLRLLLLPRSSPEAPSLVQPLEGGVCSSHQTAWHGTRKCLDLLSVGDRRSPRFSGMCLCATRHRAGTGCCGTGGWGVQCKKRAPTGQGPNSAVAQGRRGVRHVMPPGAARPAGAGPNGARARL